MSNPRADTYNDRHRVIYSQSYPHILWVTLINDMTPMKSHDQNNISPSKKNFSERLQKQWVHGGSISTCLKPLAKLNELVQVFRKKLYLNKFKDSYRAPCPVIVVGNIYVGGTGKTPVVAALVQALKIRGYHPGIISRGYGVNIGKVARVAKGGEAEAATIGDEPALLAQYAPIAVHPKRKLAIESLLKHYPQTNLIIADDGLQHLALQRDVEIVVQDERGIGNGLLLPAGPLRESANKLTDVDIIITNRNHASNHQQKSDSPLSTKPLCIDMHLKPTAVVNLKTQEEMTPEAWLKHYQNKKIAAIAGIGNPQRFFNTLAELSISPEQQQGFPDHHIFSAEDFHSFKQEIILMTEKDALKCRHFADKRFFFLKVQAEFSDITFFDKIEQLLKI